MTSASELDHPVLDQLVLGYGALFNVRREPCVARLTVHSIAGAGAAQAAHLSQALQAWWPAELGPLSLRLCSEALLDGLLEQALPGHFLLEVPSFMVLQPGHAERLLALAARGAGFVWQLGSAAPAQAGLAQELAACFAHAVVEASQEGFAGSKQRLGLPWVLAGATEPAQALAALRDGALAVQGWPLGEPPNTQGARKELPTSVRVVMDLLRRVDQNEPPERLEEVLRRDPALAFKLMRLINSPAFGLTVEINSFQHALMMLGAQRLKRWLAVLLATAVEAPDQKPLLLLAIRRGLLMEELASVEGNEAGRGEAFICGVFSLLDRMLGIPFERLLASLPVAEGVAQTLGGGSGPHQAALTLACAVEAELPFDILQGSKAMLCAPGEVNRAVLKTLVASRMLQAG